MDARANSSIGTFTVTGEVAVTIGGEPAELSAGGGPGMIGGTYLLRVRVPEGLAAGRQEVGIDMPAQPEPAGQRVYIEVR